MIIILKFALLLLIIDIFNITYLAIFKKMYSDKFNKLKENLSPLIVIPGLLLIATPASWAFVAVCYILIMR